MSHHSIGLIMDSHLDIEHGFQMCVSVGHPHDVLAGRPIRKQDLQNIPRDLRFKDIPCEVRVDYTTLKLRAICRFRVHSDGMYYTKPLALVLFSSPVIRLGCDCKLLNPLTDINGIRALSRLGRPTRSSRAPHRHDSDARAFTRALYRGGRNHVGPANMLSCASRLQDPSPRHARRNRVDFRPKISSKHRT